MKKLMQRRWQRSWGRACVAVALSLSLGALSGCDSLLDVDLPAQLTDDALEDPAGATVQVNSIIAHFDDAYDFHAYRTLGREEGGEVYLCGPMCDVSNYVTDYGHFTPFNRSLEFNRHLRKKLTENWTVQQVPLKDRYLAISSIYEGATLSVFGMNLCEITINGGKKQTPTEILNQADVVLTRALAEIQTAGDFAVLNGIATSARTMTYGLRAQVRWFKGDNAGAAADAALVPAGFTAWVTREVGPARQNRGWTSGTGGGFFELYDPIDWWQGLANPVTGKAWPTVIPFTGWTYLGILPDGRAVRDDGIPIRTRAGWHNAQGVTAGAVRDTRVPHQTALIQGKATSQGEVATKFTGEGSDIALVNWKEMVLIRAEIAGGQQAIDLVNTLRTADNLPRVTYADPTKATQIKYMIWEERRRTLFSEARFFYTKLKNLDVFWFPRDNGGTRGQRRALGGGIRYTMPTDEYIANRNLSPADKATGCAVNERPLNPR
ncbi:MAG: hypothetical protein EXR95_01395 [Gemmatimonadetes bacterium]|nr:hypothetical protein [Gemmatimonadota bacterium]